MSRLRGLRPAPLAAALVVVLFTPLPRAGAQDPKTAGQTAPAVKPRPAASAPASAPAKLTQPPIPEPTVVLKPGEVPGISFKALTYDFGRVLAGTYVEHDFEFANTGNGPLEILLIRPG